MTRGLPAGGISSPTYSSGPHGTNARSPSAAHVTRFIPPPRSATATTVASNCGLSARTSGSAVVVMRSSCGG